MTGFDSKRQAALDKLFEAENELGLHYDQRPPMTKDEALKLALEALENAEYGDYDKKELNEAITAIKKALAQPEQEPVGFVDSKLNPIKRPWVDLTDKEIDVIYEQHHNQYGECESPNFGYERAIEAKLKERNT